MSLEQLTTLDAIKQFLDGTQEVAFNAAANKPERYRWIQKTLVKHRYLQLGKSDCGTVTRYLMKVTGYSLAQTKRLIHQYVKTGTVSVQSARRNGFKRAYTGPIYGCWRVWMSAMASPAALLLPSDKNQCQREQVKTCPYEAMMTPCEKCKSLDKPGQYLKPGIIMDQRDAMAFSSTDNKAAEQLKDARQQLFKAVTEQNHQAA